MLRVWCAWPFPAVDLLAPFWAVAQKLCREALEVRRAVDDAPAIHNPFTDGCDLPLFLRRAYANCLAKCGERPAAVVHAAALRHSVWSSVVFPPCLSLMDYRVEHVAACHGE